MKKKAIIVDLDGTLANIEVRKKHLEGKKNWKKFNASIKTDTLHEWCKVIMEKMSPEYRVLIVSGRTDDLKEETIKWLQKHEITYDEIHMRKASDFRPDTVLKKEIYEQKLRPHYDVLFVLEDRQKVVDMWRSEGLTCLQCDCGDF